MSEVNLMGFDKVIVDFYNYRRQEEEEISILPMFDFDIGFIQ